MWINCTQDVPITNPSSTTPTTTTTAVLLVHRRVPRPAGVRVCGGRSAAAEAHMKRRPSTAAAWLKIPALCASMLLLLVPASRAFQLATRRAPSWLAASPYPHARASYHPHHKVDHGHRQGTRMSAAGRPSSAGKSLDARLITEEPELVLAHLKARRANEEQLSSVSDIGALNMRRKELVKEQQGALAERKTLSAEIGKLMREKKDDEAAKLKTQVEYANSVAARAEEQLEQLEQEMNLLVNQVPNLLDDRVPDGEDETVNQVVAEWGAEKRKIGGGFMWHDDIATKLGGYDPATAAKISGARFSVLSGQVARLERAIVQFFLDEHTTKNGYREVSVPYIVTRSTLTGTGQLPKFEEDLFAVNHKVGGEDSFLIPTAEVPVTNLHRDEILDASQLPLSYVALTPCFRAEAGSYGRDTKGLLRQHQFHKVELVKITAPEQSDAEHEALTGHAEACLQALGLPYRKVRLCSGDIGFSAKHCYDLEVWLPGQQEYREIASCSNCGDFQARRMALRYRPAPLGTAKEAGKGKKSTVLCHTINGSGLAVGRTLVAVLENYQNEDGSVTVPDVLVPYMGGVTRLELPAPPAKGGK